MILRTLAAFASLLGLFFTVGCSDSVTDYSQVDLHSVSGRVTLDGQPLSDALVTFESPDSQFSYGLTDAEGRYVLQFDSMKQGVTPGDKVVRISTKRRLPGMEGGEEGAPPAENAKSEGPPKEERVEQVPPQYNSKSTLTAKVEGRATFDFDLKKQ